MTNRVLVAMEIIVGSAINISFAFQPSNDFLGFFFVGALVKSENIFISMLINNNFRFF